MAAAETGICAGSSTGDMGDSVTSEFSAGEGSSRRNAGSGEACKTGDSDTGATSLNGDSGACSSATGEMGLGDDSMGLNSSTSTSGDIGAGAGSGLDTTSGFIHGEPGARIGDIDSGDIGALSGAGDKGDGVSSTLNDVSVS